MCTCQVTSNKFILLLKFNKLLKCFYNLHKIFFNVFQMLHNLEQELERRYVWHNISI